MYLKIYYCYQKERWKWNSPPAFIMEIMAERPTDQETDQSKDYGHKVSKGGYTYK